MGHFSIMLLRLAGSLLFNASLFVWFIQGSCLSKVMIHSELLPFISRDSLRVPAFRRFWVALALCFSQYRAHSRTLPLFGLWVSPRLCMSSGLDHSHILLLHGYGSLLLTAFLALWFTPFVCVSHKMALSSALRLFFDGSLSDFASHS